MRIYSLLLIVLVLPMSLLAKEVPVYQGNVEEWESSMLDYVEDWRNFVSGKASRSDIDGIRVELEKIITLNPGRPKLRIIMGGLYAAEAGIIVGDLKQNGVAREQIGKNSDYINAIKKLNENYKTALDLDDGSLSLDNFKLINGVVSNADVRVKSLRMMLKLWGEGKRFEEVDGEHGQDEWFEYNTYSNIVTAYVDEKRYDEALAVIDEIEQKFPADERVKSEVGIGRERILNFKQAEQAKEVEQEVVKETTTQKPAPIKEAAPQQPVAKAESSPQQPDPEQGTDIIWLILIGLVLAVVFVTGVMVARRRKK